jgi:hypothetical protein
MGSASTTTARRMGWPRRLVIVDRLISDINKRVEYILLEVYTYRNAISLIRNVDRLIFVWKGEVRVKARVKPPLKLRRKLFLSVPFSS